MLRFVVCFTRLYLAKPFQIILAPIMGPLFRYHQRQANLGILEIEETKSIPYTSTSHPYIVRLIGTIRWEYLNHTFFWNACELERKLEFFRQYCNQLKSTVFYYAALPQNVALLRS